MKGEVVEGKEGWRQMDIRGIRGRRSLGGEDEAAVGR
jgi:hypothetical protein